MKYSICFWIILFSLVGKTVIAEEFSVSSYNCGALSQHYDYLRAVSMQKLIQDRYNAEPEKMALNEKIQHLALKILFTQNPEERSSAQEEWNRKGYQKMSEEITAVPTQPNSPNAFWNQLAEQMITTYKIRPITIYDEEIKEMLDWHLGDLANKGRFQERLTEARAKMATRIFAHTLKYEIICLQEADYIDQAMFPAHYELALSGTSQAHSKNGIAWNRERFELVEEIGDIVGRGFVVKLLDKESLKTVLVASGHISGCNPFRMEFQSSGIADSQKGDNELKTIIELLDSLEGDIRVIGMDSNVTPLHPRLKILKDSGYHLDYENYLEPTCTNPYQVLNTRLDWITVKGDSAAITNIPVMNVGLNSMQTNISDHKPVAAKIKY